MTQIPSFMNQLPQPPEEEEEEGLALPFLGTIPSARQLSNTPNFDSTPPSEGTRRAFLGAQTESRRITEDMVRAGYAPEAFKAIKEAGEPAAMPMLDPIFDLLQIGQFTTVGFIDELQRTGNTGKAFEQAAIEFANALPGIELERARRPGWADVLKRSGMFNESTTPGRWGAAGLGLVMDVMLDPTTYTGFGTVKALRALRGAGGSAGVVDALARRSVPGAQSFGEMFLPHFQLRQFGLRGDEKAQTAVTNFLDHKQDFHAYRDTMMRDLEEVTGKLRAGLTEDESRLMTMFMDQPQFEDILRGHLLERGMSDRAEFILEKAKGFRTEWNKWADEGIAAGILDKATARYVPIRDPQTGRSEMIWSDLVDGRLYPDRMGIKDIDPEFMPPSPLELDATFNYAKQFKYAQQRIEAGVPTELDIGLNHLRRGFEQTRAMSTRRLLKAVIEDTTVVRKLQPKDAKKWLKSDATQAWYRAGYVPVNIEDLAKAHVEEAGEGIADAAKYVGDTVDLGKSVHLMPEVMVDHLKKANEVMSDPTAAGQFWNNFKTMQSIWKGYALLSPGYHMRNMYSNLFQNWLAGVTHPKRYAEAMALQAGGTDALPALPRFFVESIIGRKTLDDKFMTAGGRQYNGHELLKVIDDSGIRNTGLFSKDLMIDAERQLLTSVERNVRRVALTELTQAGSKFEAMLREVTDLSDDEVHTVALLWDARAKTWAWQTGESVDDYFRTRIGDRVVRGGDAGEGMHVLADRRITKAKEAWEWPTDRNRLLLWYGERIEKRLHKLFQRNPNPSAANLRRIPGGPGYQKQAFNYVDDVPMDYERLVNILNKAKGQTHGNNIDWYKEWGEEVRKEIGEANLHEFGGVFGIMSPQNPPEDNLSEAYMVMRLARKWWNGTVFDETGFRGDLARGAARPRFPTVLHERAKVDDAHRLVQKLDDKQVKDIKITGPQITALVNWYKKGLFKGNLKTTTFGLNVIERGMGRKFFPFTVNDVHIARLFGYGKWETKVKGKPREFKHYFVNDDQYRMAQYLIARAARDTGMDPDQAQAMLWYYAKNKLAPEPDRYGHLGGVEWKARIAEGGTWKSARHYAEPEAERLRAVIDTEDELPGWRQMYMDYEFNKNASQGQSFVELTNRIVAASSRLGEQAMVFRGGLGVGVKATYREIQDLHSDVFKAFSSDGQTIDALHELDEIMGVQHSVFHTHYGSFEGNLEPNFHIMVEGARDDAVGRLYSAILGDAMGQDSAVWYIPKRFGSYDEFKKKSAEEARRLAENFPGSRGSSVLGIRAIRPGKKFTAQEYDELARMFGHRNIDINKMVADGKMSREEFFGREGGPSAPEGGIDFTAEVGDRAIRFLNFTGMEDKDFFETVTSVLRKYDSNIKPDAFAGVSGYHGRENYADVIAGIRRDLARTGTDPSDLARRIYGKLHKQYDDILSDHSSRNGWGLHKGGDAVSNAYRDRLIRDSEVGSPLHTGMVMGRNARKRQALFQETQAGRKLASVEFDSETSVEGLMRVFEGHDVSSMLHESAHIWRRDLEGEDLAIIEKWAGVKDGKWNIKPTGKGLSPEEKFARGFEMYMREGKAPTPALEGVFARAKEWLENIYAVLVGSDLNRARINDDVRDVFDRMLGKGTIDVAQRSGDLTRDVIGAMPVSRGVSGLRQKLSEVLSKTLGTNAPHMRYNRVMGRAMENNGRMANFLDNFEKSDGNRHFARDVTNKYLFDYENGLTEFEGEVMRSVIPFYSWMRFNIPLQMQAIMEDPARYAKIPKFIQAVESVTDEWRNIQTPDYYEELHAVRLPLIQKSKPVFLNPNLPFQDLNRVNSQDILSSMTPFIKLFGELVPERGYSMFLDRPLERFPGEPSEVLPFLDRKSEHALTTLLPTFGKAQRMAKAAGRDEAPSQIMSEFMGVKLMNSDEGRVIRNSTFAQRELLRALKKRLEAEGVDFGTRDSTTRRRRRRKRQTRQARRRE